MGSATFSSSAQGAAELYDRFTDAMAAAYDDNLHYGFWPDPDGEEPLAAATVRMTDELLRRLHARRGDRVLDIGCGTGVPALRLARAVGVDITGITVSREQVGRANAAAIEAGLADTVRFQCADVMRLPFPDEAFDRAWALESLHHMPDRAKALGEVARVLRAGGRLAVGDIVLREPVTDAAGRAALARFCAEAQVPDLGCLTTYPALLEDAGLEVLHVEDVTRNTRRTFPEMIRAFRSLDAGAVGMNSGELSEKVAVFEAVSALPQFGFAFLTARKR